MDLTAKELMGLIALAGTIIAAIANILVLPGTPTRRILLFAFFLASLLLAVYTFSQHQGRQKIELQVAQRELDERTRSLRQAEDQARRRIEQERDSYESALEEALLRMRSEFKAQLEARASTLVDESTKTSEAFEELRRLVETHQSVRRADVRQFLAGSWQPKRRPPPKGIFRSKVLTNCDVLFNSDGTAVLGTTAGLYEIDEIEGANIFIHVDTMLGYAEPPIRNHYILVLNQGAKEFSIARRGSGTPADVCQRAS